MSGAVGTEPAGRLGRTTNAIATIGVAGMLIVAMATLLDVLLRWLFNAPLHGLDDIRVMSFAVVVGSCFPAVLAHGGNITIRFLGNWLGEPFASILEILGHGLLLLVFVLMAWHLQGYAVQTTDSGLGTMTYQFPQAPWWWCVAVLMWASVAVQTVVFLRHLRIRRGSGRT